MRMVVVAVGQRLPGWADAAWDDYAKLLPADSKLELKTVKTEPRNGRTAAQCLGAEAERLRAACPKGARRIVLDEHGTRRSTAQLAERYRFWRGDGRDVAFVVGGPDGIDAALKSEADETLRLSDLTLPHALARVLLAESLYRAWSLAAGHPYLRE